MTCSFVHARRCWGVFFLLTIAVVVLFIGSPHHADATVLETGDVTPSDNFFTAEDEGILEWIIDFGSIFDPPEEIPDQPTFEHPENIVVGRTHYGEVLINGGSQVRYQHLILGGDEEDIDGGDLNGLVGETTGDGVVRIEGFGTLFNNAPEVVPPGAPEDLDSTPRELGVGFDVYVGLTGSGRLEVSDGGRMEIEDSLLLGMTVGSQGIVTVDGLSSRIDQRGTGEVDGSGENNELGLTAVGLQGIGELNILNGGQVRSRTGAVVGAVSLDRNLSGVVNLPGGATLGVDQPLGGHGVVTVDGSGSTWGVQRSLAIGTFQEDSTAYEQREGSGELHVQNGGLLTVNRMADQAGNVGTLDDTADLLIGRTGRVNLAGGRIVVQDGVFNDGQLQGEGRIYAGRFHNRVDGSVRIGNGESLLVRANADADDVESDDIGSFFMANDGLIEVLGGEIEFQRLNEVEEEDEADNDVFKNRFAAAGEDTAGANGKLVGQDAIMRFGSGLSNEAVMAFTAGNNIVSGDVTNQTNGTLLISGDSRVTFEDNLTNLGQFDLAPDGSQVQVTVLGDFAGAPTAALYFDLSGGQTGTEWSQLVVAGDIDLGGDLVVDFSNGLDPMPGDEFDLILGSGELDGSFNTFNLPFLENPDWFWLVDYSDSDVTLSVIDITTFFDCLPIGGDFNGDCFVDADDLAIWQQNFGLASGATILQGDADGDGDVDGDDFFIWLDQVGGFGMDPAALVATGDLQPESATVPEPTSLMLAVGGLFTLAFRFRRRR